MKNTQDIIRAKVNTYGAEPSDESDHDGEREIIEDVVVES